MSVKRLLVLSCMSMTFSSKSRKTYIVSKQITNAIKIRDLGEARECLGMQNRRKNGEIHLSQKITWSKSQKSMKKDCKPVSTPVEVNLWSEPGTENGNAAYQEKIGLLMYLVCCTIPDISYAVTMLSQYNCSEESRMATLTF